MSQSTIAAVRQYEMKVNITLVTTSTRPGVSAERRVVPLRVLEGPDASVGGPPVSIVVYLLRDRRRGLGPRGAARRRARPAPGRAACRRRRSWSVVRRVERRH